MHQAPTPFSEHDLLARLHSLTGMQWKFVEHPPENYSKNTWQLQLSDESEQASFWKWHEENNRQRFATKSAASVFLAAAWERWRQQQQSCLGEAAEL